MVDALGSVGGEAPEHGATDEDSARTQCQGFQYIGAAPDAAIHIDFAATSDGGDDFGQGFYGGYDSVELAAAVVGDDDGVGTVLYGEFGVLGGEDAFDDDGEGGHRTEPGKGLPREFVAGVDAFLFAFGAAGDDGEVLGVAHESFGMVGELKTGKVVAEVALSFAGDGQVDGEDNASIAGRLGALDQPFRLLFSVDVELVPEGATGALCYLFHAACRVGAEGHEGLRAANALDGGAFGFGMCEAVCRRGSNQDGHADWYVQNSGVERAGTHISKDAWTQPEVIEGTAIGVECDFVVAAALIIVPIWTFHPGLRKGFVIIQVDRVNRVDWLHAFIILSICSSLQRETTGTSVRGRTRESRVWHT